MLIAGACVLVLVVRPFTNEGEVKLPPTPTSIPVEAVPDGAKVRLTCTENAYWCDTIETPIYLNDDFGARSPIIQKYPEGIEAIVLEHRFGRENENPDILYYQVRIDTVVGWVNNNSVNLEVVE